MHGKLDEFAQRYCPILQQIEEWYHWSLDEAEYATDIVFRRQSDLQSIYGNLIRTAIHTVKPDDIATFLGKKLNGHYRDEMGNRYNVRIEGTRVRHSMGMASIKMYDQFGHILRIETTVKDVSFSPRRRNLWVTDTLQWAPQARLAQPANPMWDSAASAFPVRSQLPFELVCPLR